MFKFAVLAALVACANAGALLPPLLRAAPLAYAAPIAKTVVTKITDAEYDPHPQYSYSYDVADSLTGDFKAQSETRDGDLVRGSYSLLESDGTRRIVDYAADPLNGFNAVVRKEPAAVAVKAVAPAPVAVAAAPAAIVKTAVAAPAPLAFAAPAAPVIKAAPAPAAYAAPAFAAPAAYAGPAFAAPAYAGPAYGVPAYAKPAFAAPAFAAPAFAKTFF